MKDTAPDAGRPLTPISDYRRIVLDAVEPLAPVSMSATASYGRVPVDAVRATTDLPRFDGSGMDGFAVRGADIAGASEDRPVSLRVVGTVAMGRASERTVASGEAMAVPTGGAVPDGADTVVPVEFCSVADDTVAVTRPVGTGDYVRRAGDDVRAGDVLVEPGRPLTAPDLGVLATAGISNVDVIPAARVGILSTGDEVVRPPRPLADGQIYDANAAMLSGAVVECGAVPVDLGVVADDPEALKAALHEHASDVDVFISSGGVSVGERDPVKRAFEGSGEVELYELAMQPGKPQAFGLFASKPFFGLPGNPVSVFVSFELFVRPALGEMMGCDLTRSEVGAIADAALEGLPRKTRFVRLSVRRDGDGYRAAPTGGHGSNLVAALARGDGIGIVPPGEGLRAGETCRVMLFRNV